jgi:hypothetical protein
LSYPTFFLVAGELDSDASSGRKKFFSLSRDGRNFFFRSLMRQFVPKMHRPSIYSSYATVKLCKPGQLVLAVLYYLLVSILVLFVKEKHWGYAPS